MANIQLRVWAEFAELPEAEDAIDDNVSPRFTTWLEPPAALLALLPAAAAIACEGLGEDDSSGGLGEIDEVSCDGGTCEPRAIDPSCTPVPAKGAATGALEAGD
jgi:hypothetical protein